MKKFTKRVMEFLPSLTNSMLSEPGFATFDFISSDAQMLNEFRYCVSRGNVVGVYSPVWGNGMFLVGVESIYREDGSFIIQFHSHDMSGHALSRRSLQMDEISRIVPFNNPYIQPLFKEQARMQVAS